MEKTGVKFWFGNAMAKEDYPSLHVEQKMEYKDLLRTRSPRKECQFDKRHPATTSIQKTISQRKMEDLTHTNISFFMHKHL